MTVSSLADGISLSPNYNRGRRDVVRITPHHTACVADAWTIASMFKSTARQASCNYAIGNDGSIVCVVEEEDTAWTSSSWENDSLAITVEISDADSDWSIGPAALEAFIALCVDLIQRYPSLGGSYDYTGDLSGNVTLHRWFAPTACPGPDLGSDETQAYIQAEVNRRLSGGEEELPMEFIIAPDGSRTLFYVSGDRAVHLDMPDQVTALQEVYHEATGKPLPYIVYGSPSAPWGLRLFQAIGQEAVYWKHINDNGAGREIPDAFK